MKVEMHDAFASQGMPKMACEPPEARREGWDGVHQSLRRTQPCLHLDLRYLASRTGRPYILLFVVFCDDSPRKLIPHFWSHACQAPGRKRRAIPEADSLVPSHSSHPQPFWSSQLRPQTSQRHTVATVPRLSFWPHRICEYNKMVATKCGVVYYAAGTLFKTLLTSNQSKLHPCPFMSAKGACLVNSFE